MVLEFAWLPPEINSARIFAGAGSGPLHVAATAWDGLAQDLQASASSFDSVIVGLTAGPWAGPASASMAAAATPYVGWLTAAAGQALSAGAQARAAATAFEVAQAATVHPAAVTANRVTLATLIATNFFGINAPAIAATEFQYLEMWAADVGAMLGYHAGATSVASTMAQFSVPPLSLSGFTSWLSQLGTEVTTTLSSVGSQAGQVLSPMVASVEALVANPTAALSSVESAASGLSPLTSVAQIGMYPASMMMSPLMSIAQMANSSQAATAGLAGANMAGLGADAAKFVGNAVPDMKSLGGAGGLGAGMAADLGNARLVGAMSVPPTWQGSMPARMVSSAMSGLGGMPNAAGMAGAAPGGMGMTPMPMPMGMGAGGGMPGGPLGRGGASPHVVQNRPSVVPRTGV
jgi:PPE-repeat protein